MPPFFPPFDFFAMWSNPPFRGLACVSAAELTGKVRCRLARWTADVRGLRLGANSRARVIAEEWDRKKIGGVIADHPRNRSAAVLPLLAALFLSATLLSHSSS